MIVLCQKRKCNKQCEHLGGTVGGTQLYGCPVCRVVYWVTPREYDRSALVKVGKK